MADSIIRPDGIYFNLPFDEYLLEPRFSSHGVIEMRQSALDFWSRSWMNPKKPKESEEESIFKIKGTAYHKRVCEGQRAFHESYVIKPRIEDYGDDVLKTSDDLKAVLRDIGQKVSGNKDELIERVLTFNPMAKIWDCILEDFNEQNADKIKIPAEWFEEIEVSAAHIENHPDLKHAFSGGFPEVSIFYHQDVESLDGSGEVFSVPMKARNDYVKPRAWVDLKTFSNPLGLNIKRAIAREFTNRKYYISAATYYQANDKARELAREGLIFGAEDVEKAKACMIEEKTAFYVFQKTGIAPAAVGRFVSKDMRAVQIGEIELRDAQALFGKCMSIYGSDQPWIDPLPTESFDDTEFPAYLGQ